MTKLPPAIPLYPYQQRWLADRSRMKFYLKSRQIGISFGGVSLEPVLEGIEVPNDKWVLLSAGDRQSGELIEQVQMHSQAVNAGGEYFESDFRGNDGTYKQREVRLPNGTRIIGLPANPDTARGYPSHVCLDEFASHKNSKEIWAAIFPSISRGKKIRVVGTPKGKNNMFYRLATDRSGMWSKHRTDIYQAVAEGCPQNIDELKAGIIDPDVWAQEFECQFIDAATSLLTYDLIGNCTDALASGNEPVLSALASLQNLSLGMDVARSGHLSVIWLLERVGDVLWTRAIQEMQGVRFRQQKDILYSLLELPGLYGACIDSTGIGMQMAEEANEDFGSKVEQVNFNHSTMTDMATRMLRTFQDRRVRIPEGDVIANDLHSINKVVTPKGNISYAAPETKDGHADRFWGLGLCLRASEAEAGPVRVTSPSTARQTAPKSKPRRRFWPGFGKARRALEGYEEAA